MINYKKLSYSKAMKRNWSKSLQFSAQIWSKIFFFYFVGFILPLLLSAHVERLSFSPMRNLFAKFYEKEHNFKFSNKKNHKTNSTF